jgi:hypothetical protein
MMVIKIGGKSMGKLVDYSVEIKEQYLSQCEMFLLKDILAIIDFLIGAQEAVFVTGSARIPLEIAFAKMTLMEGGKKESTPAVFSNGPSQAVSERVLPVPLDLSKVQKNSSVSANPQNANPSAVQGNEVSSSSIDTDKIKKSWDVLTHAISREKMSLSSYLQEGVPLAVENGKLIIGFMPGHEFHKEAIEDQDNKAIVERVFSEKLKVRLLVEYRMIKDISPGAKVEEESFVQAALETFKGTIVNKWNKD